MYNLYKTSITNIYVFLGIFLLAQYVTYFNGYDNTPEFSSEQLQYTLGL